MILPRDISDHYSEDAAVRRKQIGHDLALCWVLAVIDAERKSMKIAALGGKSIAHYQTCERALANIFTAAEEYEKLAKELHG